MKIDNNGLSSSNVSPREIGQKAGQKVVPSSSERAAATGEPKAATPADSVALSGEARLLGELKATAAAEPEIDQSRVESIKARIANGTYHVDPNRLASNFLDLESLLDQ